MSDIPSAIPPKKGEKEIPLPPTSFLGQKGFKRVVSSDAQETKEARASKQLKGKETIADKSIADHSITSEVIEPQSDIGEASGQLMLDEILNIIAKVSSVPDFAIISQVSKTLNKLSKETNLEKLKEFSINKQLGFKEEIALNILVIAAQIPLDLSVGDITSRAKIDHKIEEGQTSEELLSQIDTIEANYDQIQLAYNDLLQNASILAGNMAALYGTLIPVGAMLAYLALRVATFTDKSSLVMEGMWFALGGIGMYLSYDTLLQPVVMFRTAATGIMDSLTRNIGLS